MDIQKTIITTAENIRNSQKDFQNFTAYNNLFIIMASAVCVGIVTKDAITDIMNEAILPIIVFFGKKGISYFLYTKILEKTASYPILNLLIQKSGKLIWIFLTWLLVIYVAWILFRKLMKLDLVSSKVDLLENVTRYVSGEKKITSPTISGEMVQSIYKYIN